MESNLIIEGRREDILNRFNENPELQKTVEEFLDHEFNKRTNYKYVNWVLKRNFDGIGNQMMPFDDIIPYLERFDKIRKNLSKKDINQYRFQEFIDTIEDYGDTKSEERSKLKEGTERIYEDNKILVVKPLTKESSCYYGSGTKWCTAATEYGNRFEQYKSQGALYYLINKNMPPTNDYYKIAIHYDSKNDRMTLYDAKDSVNDNLLGLIKTLPAFDAIQKDISQNHKWDASKDIIYKVKEFLRLNEFNTFNVKRMVNEKPLRVQRLFDNKLIGTWGIRKFVITTEGDDFVFYATDTNVYDKRPITELYEFITGDNGASIKLYLNRMNSAKNFLVNLAKIFVEENSEYMKEGNDDIIYWKPLNMNSNYRFQSMNPDNAYIKFLDYIIDREERGLPAYKSDFLLNVLEKDPEEVNFSGYFSTMFSSMKDAGLVSLYRAKEKPYYRYKIGPNYKEWKQGRLERL